MLESKPAIEAVKEALRVTLMAIIPIILMGIDPQGKVINIDWFLVQFTAIVVLLRFVDSWLHNRTDEDGWLKRKGLTGF